MAAIRRPRRSATRRAVAAGAVLALAATLAACTSDSGASTDAVGQGYVSGDGSVQTWDLGEREGPVTVAGTDFAGNAVDVTEWTGDVVVLNTWYAGCPPCRAEASDLAELATTFEPDGVKFLGINTRDEAPTAQAFERTFEVPYPSVDDRSATVRAALSGVVPLQAVPSTVVLDAEGMVAARIIGQIDRSTLETLVEDLLAEAA
ncbi:TlpA family protein disulfide reductase [Antribacter gilvus]|uniref:TlpA family protein disulfide reductase n=1 Tax=Antribacter gilvus TaxID=2304675 RepID=UPI001F0C1D8D|nr:TlpA disulfide reductase family protein [Antribacter gilvus]